MELTNGNTKADRSWLAEQMVDMDLVHEPKAQVRVNAEKRGDM